MVEVVLLLEEGEEVLGRAEEVLAIQLLQNQWLQSCHLGIMVMTSKQNL